jgi:hypothetical protein
MSEIKAPIIPIRINSPPWIIVPMRIPKPIRIVVIIVMMMNYFSHFSLFG